ncbi:MAG: PAS domain S-box protein [Kiritimatiellae bacterium]|nr:PAS domain S-box protein [Kiritimatiellia bacterium]
MSKKKSLAQTMRIDVRPETHVGPLEERERVNAGSLHSHTAGFDQLLESIYDGVLIAGRDGIIEKVNWRAAEFLAARRESLVGQNVLNVISGASEELLSSIWTNLEDHRYTVVDAYCVRLDNSIFPAEIAVNRIEFEARQHLCFFVRDVTIRKQAQDAREEAMARLEEHDQSRLQFVANVSHELRTPLTSMIYAVANLLRGVAGPISDRVRTYLEMLDGDSKRLLGTVTDILDMRKLETNTLSLNRTHVPFPRLVRQSVDAIRMQAKQKALHIALETGQKRWFVHCDVPKMQRVIINIVGNAIKFTPEGGAIRVRVAPDPEGRRMVLLRIADSGVGIPSEDIDKVMLRYYTVGKQPSGSGLGLAIAREIVELHGGEICIMSPVPGQGRGTLVEVALPLVESPRILLVSANKSLSDRLTVSLETQGYRVSVCSDMQHQSELLTGETLEGVIMDFAANEKVARALVLQMKSERSKQRLPVVAIVGDEPSEQTLAILRSFSIPAINHTRRDNEVLDALGGSFFVGQGIHRSRTLLLSPKRSRE